MISKLKALWKKPASTSAPLTAPPLTDAVVSPLSLEYTLQHFMELGYDSQFSALQSLAVGLLKDTTTCRRTKTGKPLTESEIYVMRRSSLFVPGLKQAFFDHIQVQGVCDSCGYSIGFRGYGKKQEYDWGCKKCQKFFA